MMFARAFRTFSSLLNTLPTELPPTRAFIVRGVPPKLVPSDTIRLSKRLSESGVCSRRQAERILAAGMVKVDGKTVFSNVGVTEANKIEIQTRQDEKTRDVPIRSDTRLWVFYKPCKMITTHNDPQKRITVFDFLKSRNFPADHIISVGRLDFNSEGILLLTNNGDLARALELPENKIEREYRVRAYGRWKDEDLEAMKKGVTIKGRHFRPMAIWCQRKQTSNTWFRAILTEGKNREIRRIMEHFDLRVNRLVRVRYGPFNLEGLLPGDYREERISGEMHSLLLKSYKTKAREAAELDRLTHAKL
mmetsp:Transcript_15648/g.28475  ORF Transcript_15648/g.28475 Transcript_15648/m.28475 type:complete len:305 (-) Transcript_15648:8-922(-)